MTRAHARRASDQAGAAPGPFGSDDNTEAKRAVLPSMYYQAASEKTFLSVTAFPPRCF